MDTQDKILGSFFDEAVSHGAMVSFSPEEEAKLEPLIKLWDLKPGQRVLEPGCGSGRLTERLAQLVLPGGGVWGVDLSAEMIKVAKGRNLPSRVSFTVDTASSLPHTDGFFDKVICFNAFPHFSDTQKTLKEFRRVLKPEGEFWIAHTQSREELNDFHSQLSEVVAHHHLPERKDLEMALQKAGFKIALFGNGSRGYWVQAVLD